MYMQVGMLVERLSKFFFNFDLEIKRGIYVYTDILIDSHLPCLAECHTIVYVAVKNV